MAVSLAPQTILVIDDERGPRESLRILLKKNYRVLCADSVDWGIELLKQNQPDAVVMDIKMPDKTGIEGLREIREIDKHISVIMLTGFGTLETAQEAIRLGANDYLKKPFDAKEMEEVITRNIHRTQTERRHARAEHTLTDLINQLREEMAGKEHMATLGQKSAELVHDLRNPLTAVMGYVELLAEQMKEFKERLGDRWEETAEYLTMIEKSASRCKDLTDMWLSLGKRDPQRMKPVSVRALLNDVIKGVSTAAVSRGVHIDFLAEHGEYEVAVDRVQVFRALQNVLVNAIEAVPNETGQIRVFCGGDPTQVEIRVQDNGCGMNQDQMQRVFEPYFTTKSVNGTGLGLFITKKVIEDHHGSIELQSQPNAGTLVSIRLPLLDRPEVAIA